MFSKAGHWLLGTNGQKSYIVGEAESFWLLFEIEWSSGGMRLARSMPDGIADPLLADRTVPKNRFTTQIAT